MEWPRLLASSSDAVAAIKVEQRQATFERMTTVGSLAGGGEFSVATMGSLTASGDFSVHLNLSDCFEVDPNDLSLEGMIAAGQTAEVFCGDFEGSRVAIKRYRDATDYFQRKVARELETLSKLDHPNLLGLIGACTLTAPFQLVTELCDGGTLYGLLYETCEVELSWHQRVKAGADIAAGMAYLHGRDPPILHRDLASLNCLLAAPVTGPSDEVTVKVGNFRYSRAFGKFSGASRMTTAVGTLAWVAPEVLRGDEYDEKVDVYSFGIIAHELASRIPPFEDMDACACEIAVIQGERPDLEDVPGDCPRAFLECMEACWAQDPAERPSFDEVVVMLRPCV